MILTTHFLATDHRLQRHHRLPVVSLRYKRILSRLLLLFPQRVTAQARRLSTSLFGPVVTPNRRDILQQDIQRLQTAIEVYVETYGHQPLKMFQRLQVLRHQELSL